ncbi:hypothetical protein DOTSEDRAFT_162329 [Dothistroma septosporum NZE10]|uniref:Cercosporin MFS transporter CTB4 n=1 Tax=Dothistroma septosporum (strain NZE10 / CBS 128990) TaxID=675120 RepID=N1Q201_DOTSN|nr:hypothetical protein DOTSEDRAFT_162329 [Dothistroma septosporum NZE10]
MALGEDLERILSRPTAKPYRNGNIQDRRVYLNADGHVDFAPNDIENPKNWSTPRRWYITCVTVSLVISATFASSAPSGALPSLAEELHVSTIAANLVTTLFLLGYCFGPLFWAPLSEFFGRRYIFYIAFILYFAFNFLCAFTPNFGGLLVGRFFTGTLASAALSNVPGVLADLWGPIERGNAMVVFSMMTFAGPALGPVVAGFLQLKKDWRWVFYVLIWLAFGTMIPMLTIPETLPSRVLTNKARRIRKAKIPGYENVHSPVEAANQTLASIYTVALTRPWIILFDPISFLVAVYLSIVYALLYSLFTIYPIVFQQKRGWNAGVGELPLIGTMIGAFIAGGIVFYESTIARKRMLAGIERTPEDRMPLAMIGGIVFAVSMFWFAWSGEYNQVPWPVVTLAGVFLSTGIVLIFVSYLNYLADSYLLFAASAIAANTVCRSAVGAAAPLFTEQMFDALGVGPAGSLIGGVATLLAPIPFLFYRYGATIRKKSRFAPTDEGGTSKNETAESADHASQEDRYGSDKGELALDEEAGVLGKVIEKASREGDSSQSARDPYLDVDGLEKAER